MEVKLVVIGGKQAGMEIPVRKPKFLVGRGDECQLRPQSQQVSRKHFAILVEEGSAAIEDAGSTNGTFVNGEKIIQQRKLHNGDRIRIGMVEFEARLTPAAADKKKPKVRSVREAAVRTVASVANDDDEISQWLAEENKTQSVASPSEKPGARQAVVSATQDTMMGKTTDDTTTSMPSDQNPPKQEKKSPPVKVAGHFKQPAKPMADSSRSAAEEMLRQFFPGKKM